MRWRKPVACAQATSYVAFTMTNTNQKARKAKAKRFVARINANVAAMYADDITFEAFGENQKSLWDAIDAAGVKEDVLRLLRGQMRA